VGGELNGSGQTTLVAQRTNAFRAPYAGPNSLEPSDSEETFDGWEKRAVFQTAARVRTHHF
jgi:hypothetical protein